MDLILGALALLGAAAPPEGFTGYGVAAKVAECRGVVTTRDANGRNLAIAMALDESPLGYIVVTDVDSGETKQFPYPAGTGNSPVFASLMSRNGRLYTGAGKVLLEFDPAAGKWLFKGIPQKAAECFVGSAIVDGPEGLIYVGTYPNCHLVSYDPKTQEMKDYGQLDPKEHYLNTLAFDSAGWAYAGIGTARWSIAACNPKTGEVRQLIPDEERQQGTASVSTGADGKAYGVAGAQWYRLFEGKCEKIARADVGPRVPTGAIGWGTTTGAFPDGRQVARYNLPEKWLEVKEPKSGQTKRIPLAYDAGGVQVTSLCDGPEGTVYASSCHPMHLIRLDPKAGALQDLGPVPTIGGGNLCAMARLGNRVYGAAYAHGGLWEYDSTQPWQPAGAVKAPGNPRLLAEWARDVCRPRTALVHPDQKHVLFAGFANYGLCGGGIGIVNAETGEGTLLTADKDLLPGHSTITLKALADGNLVGGTSIEAPGGGHTVAKDPELYLLDWATRKITWHAPILPGAGDIISIVVGEDRLVYGLTARSTLFVFDPARRQLVHQANLAEFGGVPRHALQLGRKGEVYAMLSKAILRITPETFAHVKLTDAPMGITAGGAWVDGLLCFASGPCLWSYRVPAR